MRPRKQSRHPNSTCITSSSTCATTRRQRYPPVPPCRAPPTHAVPMGAKRRWMWWLSRHVSAARRHRPFEQTGTSMVRGREPDQWQSRRVVAGSGSRPSPKSEIRNPERTDCAQRRPKNRGATPREPSKMSVEGSNRPSVAMSTPPLLAGLRPSNPMSTPASQQQRKMSRHTRVLMAVGAGLFAGALFKKRCSVNRVGCTYRPAW